MFDPKVMGARLKSLRLLNGCKQDEIAHDLELTQSSVSSQEKGNSVPSVQALYWYAQRYNTSADYILGLIDDPNPIKKDSPADAEEWAVATDSSRIADLLKDPKSLERFVRSVVDQALLEKKE